VDDASAAGQLTGERIYISRRAALYSSHQLSGD
jgi:hypothetical protein